MSRRPENPGICTFCGEIVTKRGSYKHLDKCQKWQAALRAAAASRRPEKTLWILRVQDAYNKDYWLNLEMVGSASLEKLDYYLRAIWLECCGHLSEFTIGGWGGQEVGINCKADAVFAPGIVLRHLYDFGTTSETDIKVVGFREGKAISKNPIALLARNQMPEAACQECGKKANWLCFECLIEYETTGLLCDAHAEIHPHDEYAEPISLVNSPRMGMCGYDGPAEPPY